MQGDSSRRRQEGAALFVAVMMLALMGALGIAAMSAVTRDREAAGYYNRNKSAFYAAEAAASRARRRIAFVEQRNDDPTQANFRPGVPDAFPTQAAPAALGDAALYDREPQLPVYYGDPAVAPFIDYVRDGMPYRQGGGLNWPPKYKHTLWRINVVGESPDGSSARIEVMETRLLGNQ